MQFSEPCVAVETCPICHQHGCKELDQLTGKLSAALDAVQVLCEHRPDLVSRFFTRLRNENEPPVLPTRAAEALTELIRELHEPPPPRRRRRCHIMPRLRLVKNLP